MIIELCKGGPHDGSKFEVISDAIPLEWRAASKFCKSKEVVYRFRPEEIVIIAGQEQNVKFDFAGYENALAHRE